MGNAGFTPSTLVLDISWIYHLSTQRFLLCQRLRDLDLALVQASRRVITSEFRLSLYFASLLHWGFGASGMEFRRVWSLGLKEYSL